MSLCTGIRWVVRATLAIERLASKLRVRVVLFVSWWRRTPCRRNTATYRHQSPSNSIIRRKNVGVCSVLNALYTTRIPIEFSFRAWNNINKRKGSKLKSGVCEDRDNATDTSLLKLRYLRYSSTVIPSCVSSRRYFIDSTFGANSERRRTVQTQRRGRKLGINVYISTRKSSEKIGDASMRGPRAVQPATNA